MMVRTVVEQGLRSAWRTYRLYGVTVVSDYPFATRLAPGTGEADLTFTCVDERPTAPDWEATPPVFEHRVHHEGDAFSYIHQVGDLTVLRYSRVADFYLTHDRIVCHLRDPEMAFLIEIRLLGPTLALWLELRGVVALHGSAVVIDGEAVGFLSGNGGGKTSVAATLMREGASLLSDDLIPVDADTRTAYAGSPQMRMWPPDAEHFAGSTDGLELVHPYYTKLRVPLGAGGLPGTFDPDPHPLRALYVLDRGEEGIEPRVTDIPAGQAVIELVRHSFVCEFVEALGMQQRRFASLARLLQAVRVRHVRHATPRGAFGALAAGIAEDVRSLPQPSGGGTR
jgi:hypothetical protein